jgi:phosphate uptake regulator
MYTRRLVKAGAASYTVALPKDWVESNSLKKGDTIYIRNISGNELLVSTELKAERQEQKEITLSLENKTLDTLHREITSAYMNNYSTINIIGDELYKNIKDIRKLLDDFVALEITEQTATKIVAKDMLNLKEVSVDKTIRRMDIIVRSIIKDLIEPQEDMADSINYRDSDVNRLYFLSSKIIKTALSDPDIAKLIGIEKYSDILSIWYLILNLEGIADNTKEIYFLSLKVKKDPFFKELAELYKETEKYYLDVMKAYYAQDKVLADNVAVNRSKIIKKCDEMSEKYRDIQIIKATENIKEIENSICNIARIVIDKG